MSNIIAKNPSLEELTQIWKEDCVVDTLNPDSELIKIPVLHAKYSNFLVGYKLLSKKHGFDFIKLKRLKWQYYSGKLDKEKLDELGWEPFKFVLKTEINLYLESDPDLIEIEKKIQIYDLCIDYCTNAMKELHSRTFQLKEYMGWQKFTSGAN